MEEGLEKLKRNEELGKQSSLVLESTTEVNKVNHSYISFSHENIFVGNMEEPILRTGMGLLT